MLYKRIKQVSHLRPVLLCQEYPSFIWSVVKNWLLEGFNILALGTFSIFWTFLIQHTSSSLLISLIEKASFPFLLDLWCIWALFYLLSVFCWEGKTVQLFIMGFVDESFINSYYFSLTFFHLFGILRQQFLKPYNASFQS